MSETLRLQHAIFFYLHSIPGEVCMVSVVGSVADKRSNLNSYDVINVRNLDRYGNFEVREFFSSYTHSVAGVTNLKITPATAPIANSPDNSTTPANTRLFGQSFLSERIHR